MTPADPPELRALSRSWLALSASFASVAGAFAMLAGCAIHARVMRDATPRDKAALVAVASILPSPDLAFTGGARWLRAVSVEEPGAAQADGIGFPDPEPGGGAIAAPREAWFSEWPATVPDAR